MCSTLMDSENVLARSVKRALALYDTKLFPNITHLKSIKTCAKKLTQTHSFLEKTTGLSLTIS